MELEKRDRDRELANGRGRGCGQQNVFGRRCQDVSDQRRSPWRVMRVEARELTDGGLVCEGTSGAEEWGGVEVESRKKRGELQWARYHA